MKTLALMRHAKSSWADEGLSDYDRPLNNRGKHDALMMGKRLVERGVQPDILLSSPAKRVRKTTKAIAKAIDYNQDDIVYEDRLYLADISDLFYSILEHNQDADYLMMFGHNPGITDFSNLLAGCGIENVPTCGIVTVEFTMDSWTSIESTKGRLVEFDYPQKKEG